jgi:hypothetical protein
MFLIAKITSDQGQGGLTEPQEINEPDLKHLLNKSFGWGAPDQLTYAKQHPSIWTHIDSTTYFQYVPDEIDQDGNPDSF